MTQRRRLVSLGLPQAGRLDFSPWQVVGLVFLLYIGVVLHLNQWDPMALVRVGTRFDPGLESGTLGYDGQFSWQIARQPLEGWAYTDKASYRYQRILYPALAGLISLGNERAIPWALIAINLAAVVAGTFVTGRILRHFGASPWYGLVYGLNVGMLMAVRLDLNEPLAFLCFQAGVLASVRKRWIAGAAAFGLAALAKEVTLVLIAGYALYLVLSRKWRLLLPWTLIAVGPFLAWQAILRIWLGDFGFDSGGRFATGFQLVPLKGWWSLAYFDLRWFAVMSLLLVPLVILPSLLALWVSFQDVIRRPIDPTTLAVLTQSLAVVFLPSSNILDPLGVSRFLIGLIAALLTYGAYRQSPRILRYTQLWLLTTAFLIGDSFLPRA
jgi:hypothetical protein